MNGTNTAAPTPEALREHMVNRVLAADWARRPAVEQATRIRCSSTTGRCWRVGVTAARSTRRSSWTCAGGPGAEGVQAVGAGDRHHVTRSARAVVNGPRPQRLDRRRTRRLLWW
jgi:hypothetical protein